MSTSLRIRLSDTDAAGLLFGPALFRLTHDACEDFMARLGYSVPSWVAHKTLTLPLVHLSGTFVKPLRLGDPVRIAIVVERISQKSFTLAYRIMRGRTTCATATSTHVVVAKKTGRAAALPRGLARALKAAPRK